MPDFYANMQSVASGVLAQFKQGTIQHVAITPGGGPAHNPGTPTTVTTTLPGAVAAGVEKRYIDRGLAVAGDLQITSSIVDGLTVAMGDQMTVDGVPYRVVQIISIPAAGTPVVRVYIVRR